MTEKKLDTLLNIPDIALAYIDETDGMLKEIDESVYFAVSAMSFKYKRLFVIGERIYDSLLTIRAYIEDDVDEDYIVKLNLGQKYNGLESFQYSTNQVNGTYDINYKYENALPLDVLVTSKHLTEKTFNLKFSITYGDDDPENHEG